MCISRQQMPQVDGKDIPGLLCHLHDRGILSTRAIVPVKALRYMQCMSETRPASDTGLLAKPILVSRADMCIVDGNGRAMQHEVLGLRDAEAYMLECDFYRACKEILTYDHAYRYCDGPQPYRV